MLQATRQFLEMASGIGLEQRPTWKFCVCLELHSTLLQFRRQSSYFCSPMMGNTIRLEASLHADLLCKCIDGGLQRKAGVQMAWSTWSIVDGPTAGERDLHHPDFAGISLHSSTGVFPTISEDIVPIFHKYKSYPKNRRRDRWKDFVIAHKSADAKLWQWFGLGRSFLIQGQNNGLSSIHARTIPSNLWKR